MASKSLLTYGSKIASVEQTYFAPTVVIPTTGNNLASLYCLLSKVDNWSPDDNYPDNPKQDQKTLKELLKRAFVAKKIRSDNIIPVIRRVDWTLYVAYDYYDDTVDMFEVDTNGIPVKNFYVKNKYDQVFKCLWNNADGPSLEEPYFEPGTYGTNNIYQGSDGYKWKYIYTVDNNSKINFMDNTWLPISIPAKTPNPLVDSYGTGGIDVINITNSGSDYNPANAAIYVTIVGDGSGATAEAVANNSGMITNINVTNHGINYTYADVKITSGIGSGATAIAPVSPIGGHAYDPISELGCRNVMIVCTFNGDESFNGVSMIPTDIDYHQIALLVNPVTKSSSPLYANGDIYKTSTDLIVSSGFGDYALDELIYQGTSPDTASFTATVLSFDSSNNIIHTINTTGTLETNSLIYGNTSKTTRTLLSYTTPEFLTLSGYVSYIENRSAIQRSHDGIEQVKIILGY